MNKKSLWGGEWGCLHEKKSLGGGSEIVGAQPPPPHVFLNGIALRGF